MQTSYDPLLDENAESQASVWLKRIAIVLLGLLVLAALGYGIKKLMSGGDSHPKKKITTIALTNARFGDALDPELFVFRDPSAPRRR